MFDIAVFTISVKWTPQQFKVKAKSADIAVLAFRKKTNSMNPIDVKKNWTMTKSNFDCMTFENWKELTKQFKRYNNDIEKAIKTIVAIWHK